MCFCRVWRVDVRSSRGESEVENRQGRISLDSARVPQSSPSVTGLIHCPIQVLNTARFPPPVMSCSLPNLTRLILTPVLVERVAHLLRLHSSRYQFDRISFDNSPHRIVREFVASPLKPVPTRQDLILIPSAHFCNRTAADMT